MPLSLGQRVTFSSDDILYRVSRDEPAEFNRIQHVKEWSTPAAGRQVWSSPAREMHGVVVGVRTLADGHNEHHGWDVGIEFHPTRHFQAYLVAYDLRRKPVFVLADNLREE